MTEVNSSGVNDQSGWYRHKDTGAVVQLLDDPELGTPLTNSFIAAGYEFVGATDPREKEQAASTKANKEK